MGLYQFYNADLLDIPSEPNQLAIAYVDNAILFASGSTFEDTHKMLHLYARVTLILAYYRPSAYRLKAHTLLISRFSHYVYYRPISTGLYGPHATQCYYIGTELV